MNTTANKTLVANFWEAFSALRLDEAFALLADDASWWVAGDLPISGTYTKPQFETLVRGITEEFPQGIEVKPTIMTAEEDRVAVEATSYGERSNGRIYKNKYHFQNVIRDGKLFAVREYLDTKHANEILCL